MRPSTRRISIPPAGAASRAPALAGVIAGMALALLPGCSPSSGLEPPQLLAANEIAALSAQAAPGAPAGGEGIDAMAAGLTGAPATAHPGTADLGPRGDALRARAAALRGRNAAQSAENVALRSRAEALRQASQARATAVEGEDPDDEDDEEERRRRGLD
ncbi:MAG: hypothetical protein JJT95_14025 [Pararhodobacter sp.]|nr:hypothetical protein [Pararhodobacter sp.]